MKDKREPEAKLPTADIPDTKGNESDLPCDKIKSILDLSGCKECKSKTFLLGIGAQRSGTTWISRYLDKHPDVGFSPVKELHVFDSLILRQDQQIEAHFATNILNKPFPNSELQERLYHATADRLAIPLTKGGYFRFFEKRAEPMHLAFGEITPEYALIPGEAFKILFESHPNIRFLYILRDPCHRYLSALSYWGRLRPHFKAQENVISGLDRSLFTRYSLYNETLKMLLEHVPRERILVLFMEELFDDPETNLRALCDFLCIRYRSLKDLRINSSDKVNSTRNDNSLISSEEEIRIIRNRFTDVYNDLPMLIGRPLPKEWSHP